jgi:hypothetical protein
MVDRHSCIYGGGKRRFQTRIRESITTRDNSMNSEKGVIGIYLTMSRFSLDGNRLKEFDGRSVIFAGNQQGGHECYGTGLDRRSLQLPASGASNGHYLH